MSKIIDLDLLVPQSVVIKFGGQEITIEPPKTVDLLILGSLTEQLLNVAGMTEQEVQSALDKMVARLTKCIPQLEGKELTKSQIQKLVDILADMARPDVQEQGSVERIGEDSPKAP